MRGSGTTTLRRPNGRLQACDPCRVRKVACDHTQPVCRRCLKRGQRADCVYITDGSPRRKPSRAAAQLTPVSDIASVTLPFGASSVILVSDDSRRNSQEPNDPPLNHVEETVPSSAGFGYLGATSYSCVFEETTRALDPIHGTSIANLGLSSSHNNLQVQDIPAPLKQMCLMVLRRIPSHDSGHILVGTGFLFCGGTEWLRIATLKVLDSLHTIYKPYLEDIDDEARLMELARIISHNTTQPFRTDIRDPQAWLDQFLDGNLRWESIGLIFTLSQMGPSANALATHLWKPHDRTCLSCCIELSRHYAEGNDILLYLYFKRVIMDSVVVGDASLACWRGLGEAVTLLTYLGIHDQSDQKDDRPYLASQVRRRMFISIYHMDKTLVSFTGRPPLLTARFVSVPLPLDIADEVLLSDEESIAKAAGALDDNGWDPNSAVHPTAFLRGRVMLSFVHADLLECALDVRTQYPVEHIRNLKQRALETFESLPAHIKYTPESLTDRSVAFGVLYGRLLMHLEHLRGMFFAERMLARCGEPNEEQLLHTSFDMVNYTLIFWTQQERLSTKCTNLEWLVMAFAAPASGVLCSSLLRPSRYGILSPGASIKCSSIIQSLSLLVACLDQIPSTAPNGALSANCKRIVQYVLDYRLNTTPETNLNINDFDWELPTQVEFDFDLLDTFDWVQQTASGRG